MTIAEHEVVVSLEGETMTVRVITDGDNEPAQAAASAWSALCRKAEFVIGDQTFTATECAEWWA